MRRGRGRFNSEQFLGITTGERNITRPGNSDSQQTRYDAPIARIKARQRAERKKTRVFMKLINRKGRNL